MLLVPWVLFSFLTLVSTAAIESASAASKEQHPEGLLDFLWQCISRVIVGKGEQGHADMLVGPWILPAIFVWRRVAWFASRWHPAVAFFGALAFSTASNPGRLPDNGISMDDPNLIIVDHQAH